VPPARCVTATSGTTRRNDNNLRGHGHKLALISSGTLWGCRPPGTAASVSTRRATPPFRVIGLPRAIAGRVRFNDITLGHSKAKTDGRSSVCDVSYTLRPDITTLHSPRNGRGRSTAIIPPMGWQQTETLAPAIGVLASRVPTVRGAVYGIGLPIFCHFSPACALK
jgi:hypothetical protein